MPYYAPDFLKRGLGDGTLYVTKYENGHKETVAACETHEEALVALHEHRLSDPYAELYLSFRACPNWNGE